MIRGPIAVVWGEYEFLIDGQFSHCGIDSVGVVKLDLEASRVGVTRQSIIKMWLAERLENSATNKSLKGTL